VFLDDSDPYPTGYTVGDIWAPQKDGAVAEIRSTRLLIY
jgi:hypothetical protein